MTQRMKHRCLRGHVEGGSVRPQKYTASRDNEAERRELGLLYRFTSGMICAAGFSNVSLGIARGALEAAFDPASIGPRGLPRAWFDQGLVSWQQLMTVPAARDASPKPA